MVPSSKKSGVTWMGPRPGQGPALSLAIFGKHPGWDDHIDDLGLETSRLIDAKRTLYLDALSGSIDSGAWEKLDPAQLLPDFGHELVWFSPAGLIVGRLWASRDGKGRTKYPMFVVAHCEGISAQGVADVVMPRLAEVERLCSSTTSADDVRRILDDARNQLREAIKATPGEAAPAEVRMLSAITDSPALGPERVGLHRVLYEVQRELGAPRGKSDRKSMTRLGDGPAQHLRVPACAPTAFDSARLWAGLLAVRTDRSAQTLVLRAHGTDYCDLLVSGVTASTLFCLRASLKGLPLASDVPYTLDPVFVAQCEASAAAWREGRAQPDDAPRDPTPPPRGPMPSVNEPAADADRPSEPAPKKWFKSWLGMGAVAAGLAVVAGAAFVMTQNKSPAPAAGATGASKAAEIASVRKSEPAEDEREKKEAQAKALADAERARREEAAKEASAREAAARDLAAREAKAKEDAAKALAAKELEARDEAAKVAEANRVAEAKKTAEANRVADTRKLEEANRLAEEKKKSDEAQRLAEAERAASEAKGVGERILAEGARILGLLDRGFTATEAVDGTNVKAAAAVWLADKSFVAARESDARVKDAEKTIANRLAAFAAIEKTSDVPSLVQQASAASPLAESLAAWNRLAGGTEIPWPASDADFEAAGRAMTALKAASNRVKDGARAAELSAQVESKARAIWSRGMALAVRSGNDEAVSLACARAAGLGVNKDAPIAVSDRYNVLLSEFKRDLRALGDVPAADAGKVAALSQRVKRFESESSSLGAEVLSRAEASASAIATAAALVTLSAPVAKAPETVAAMGPGLRGWASTARVVDAVEHIVFTPPASGASLEFVRVEAPNGPVFLATTEVSVGDVVNAVDTAGKWSELAEVLPPPAAGKPDARAGPRTWMWAPTSGGGAPKIQPSVAGPGDTSGGWLPSSPTMQNQPYYPGKPPEAPTANSPMNQITAPAAAFVATLLGCRLPTSDEWLAAAGDARRVNPAPNYRDATWKTQLEFIKAVPGNRRPEFPDGGIFWPTGVKKLVFGSALPVESEDDKCLWFAPVSSGEGVLRHLLGNVAELCINDTKLLSGQMTAKAIAAALGRGELARVVGASALSPREVDPKTPYPLESAFFARQMFSDVGFRLAFSPTGSAAVGATTTKPVVVSGSELAAALKYVPGL